MGKTQKQIKRRKIIVTIDGPAASGKGTATKLISSKLGFKYLDSGILYRAFAFFYTKNRNIKKSANMLSEVEFKRGRLLYGGKDITDSLRGEDIGKVSSMISKKKEVRELVSEKQREIVRGDNFSWVVDGRDAGSYVFPSADIKFYLDASIQERARRRYKELLQRGKKSKFSEVLSEINIRDKRDKTRKIAPLVIPKDAVYIDSTEKTPEDVSEIIIKHIKNLMNARR